MQRWKTRLFWTLVVLLPVLCAFAVGWRGYVAFAQQQQNHALIAAVWQDDVPGVTHALAHGADPNARDVPPDNRPLWRRLLNFLHGKPPNQGATHSALHLAVQHDLNYEVLTSQQISFPILKALHDAGAVAEGDAPQYLPQTKEDARTMAALPDVPLEGSGDPSAYSIALCAREHLLAQGMSAYAYATIGQDAFRDHDYSNAIHRYRIAQLWQPNDAAIQAGLAQAEALQRVKTAIERQLPAGSVVISVRPFPAEPGRSLWAIVYGGPSKDAPYPTRVAVALYAEQDGGYTRLCESKPFAHNNLQLCVMNATGRRLPEIVVTERGIGENADFSSLHIYEVKAERLHTLLALVSPHIPSLVDLRHNGRYVVRNQYVEDGRLNPPDWPSPPHFYAFNGSTYTLADRDYPEEFRGFMPEAQKALQENPREYSLLYSIAYVYSVTGQPQKAEEYYHRAEQACRERLERGQGPSLDSEYKSSLQQILARVPEPNF